MITHQENDAMRRMIWVLAVGLMVGAAKESRAQYPVPTVPQLNQAYAPNFYNRANQPLSPYLNLFRGNSAAVNYYYGVRPGTQRGSAFPNGNYQNFNQAGPRYSFVPVTDSLGQLDELDPSVNRASVPSTGHPISFNNTSGYYPGAPGQGIGMGGRNRFNNSQMQGTGGQPQQSRPRQ